MAQKRVEGFWSPEDDAVACLSVRSGFDQLLEALAWPPGSEILVSALTIRDMARIVEAHRLVPVPIDLDMDSLSVKIRELPSAMGSSTKGLLVAHLFGSRMPLDELASVAKRLGLYLIEDCAQSYARDGYRGSPASDAVLFSFGPIKTATALGGGIVRIQDPAIRAKVKALQAGLPIQSRGRFLRRLLLYTALKCLTYKGPFTAFRLGCGLLRRSHDEIINGSVRGFPGPDFFRQIRQQPSYPLLALLERRLHQSDRIDIQARVSAAETAIRLMPHLRHPGTSAQYHTHWLFPARSESPDKLVEHLWRNGFDATRGASNLFAVPAPGPHPDLRPSESLKFMEQVLYLPVYAGVSDRELRALAEAVNRFEQLADTQSRVGPPKPSAASN